MSVEGYLIEHCAPTLASLKTASLFSCPCRGQEDLQKELAEMNSTTLMKRESTVARYRLRLRLKCFPAMTPSTPKSL